MIYLSEIKKVKGNKYLVTCLIDDVKHVHVLTEDTIIKNNFLRPREVSKREYDLVIVTNEEDILYQKAIHFIDFQMRTISEVKKHLRKVVLDEVLIQKIIHKLKKQGFLDDDKYVKEYITQKIEFDLVGPRYIKEKLIGKGIHFDLIDQNLIQYSTEHQFDKIHQLIVKETRYPIKKPYKKAYLSIKSKLVSKGFSLNIIESCLISNNEQIKEAVDESPLLEADLKKLLKQYDISVFEDKDKVIKKLMQKGYHYGLIKEYLS